MRNPSDTVPILESNERLVKVVSVTVYILDSVLDLYRLLENINIYLVYNLINVINGLVATSVTTCCGHKSNTAYRLFAV